MWTLNYFDRNSWQYLDSKPERIVYIYVKNVFIFGERWHIVFMNSKFMLRLDSLWAFRNTFVLLGAHLKQRLFLFSHANTG